jgi:hypothetical protein
VIRYPPPDSCDCRRHSHSCGEMSNRPPRAPSGRSWGQARWSDPPTPPFQATQGQDALNQELPAGLPTLAIDVNNSHSCCGMIKGPCAPQWTTLGSGLQGRFSNPSRSPSQAQDTLGPARPTWPGLRWSTGLQYPWTSCASIKSAPHVSSPSGSQAVSAQALCAPSESAQGQYPVAYRLSVPYAGAVCCLALRAFFAADQVCFC